MNCRTLYLPGPSHRSRRAAFTLIELLVVIGIIVALIAITIPTTVYVKQAAKRNTTDQTMAAIRMGMDAYFTQFGAYPDSTFVAPFTTGSQMLARGLMGFQDYNEDGAGPGNPAPPAGTGADAALGFRQQKGGRGKVYGPYVNNDPKYYVQTGFTDAAFVDAWGNPILYYEATKAQNPTLVFGNLTTGLFVEADNPGTPSTGTQKFFSKIGTTSNTISGGVVPSRDSFLLISAGVDGIYFNDDDVVSSR